MIPVRAFTRFDCGEKVEKGKENAIETHLEVLRGRQVVFQVLLEKGDTGREREGGLESKGGATQRERCVISEEGPTE